MSTTRQIRGEFIDIMHDDDWGLIFDNAGMLRGIFIPDGKTEDDIPDALLDILHLYELDLYDAKDAVIH